EAAFKSANHVTKLDIINNRLVPNAIEPRAAIADYDAGNDALTLWNTSQNPHVARLVIAAFVGLAPEHKLRVIAPDVGGGFGSKIFIYNEEVVALWAAKKVGRPVKWVSDRSEAFLSDAHGRDHVTHAEMAVGAREMALDPAELRRRNFIRAFPHQTPVIMTYDAGDYHALLKKALDLADVKGFGKRKRDSARAGKLRGIGFSTYIEACGIAPSQAVGSLGAGVGLWESAEVRVNPTGSVEILTGSHSHGQGHETTFAQLVSQRLG